MDVSQIAQATTFILGSCLPYLLDGSDAADRAASKRLGVDAWEQAKLIWARLQPGIETRQAAKDAVQAVADDPNEETQAKLQQQLEALFDENEPLADEIHSLISNSVYSILLDSPEGERPTYPRPAPHAPVSRAAAPGRVVIPGGIPACMACGRQDETLRIVIFPYVFSIIFATFRRSFIGLWCRRHQNERLALAGLITASAGWLGIPFGFIWTPLTLFKLALGGVQPAEANAKMLRDLAEHKLTSQEPRGAIPCLEEALKFGEQGGIGDRLAELYREHGVPPAAGVARRLLPLVGAMLGAALLGGTAGLLDGLFTEVCSLLFPGEVSIYVVIFIWAVTVALAFAGGLLLSRIIEGALTRARIRQRLLGGSLAAISALIAAYGLPTGEAVGYMITHPSDLASASVSEAIYYLANLFTWGGAFVVRNNLTAGETPGIIYVLIVLAAAGFYLVNSVYTAITTVNWQRQIADIRKKATGVAPPAFALGWAPIGGALLAGLAVLALSLFLTSGPDYGDQEALAHVEEGMALLDQGEADEARQEFEEAIRIDPDASPAYLGLGFAQVHTGDCEEATDSFKTAIALAPDDEMRSVAHYGLGGAYLCLEDLDPALQECQQAVALTPDWPMAQLALGLAYYGQGEFEKAAEYTEVAVELNPEWSFAHTCLATTYYMLDWPDAMDQALQRAKDLLNSEDADGHYALGSLYYALKEFSTAEAYLEKAHELDPEDADTLITLARTYTAQKKFDLALQAIDRALEIDEGNTEAHVARSDVYYAQEDLDVALEELLLALEIDPEYSEAHSALSFVYFQKGQTKQALEEAQAAVALHPYNYSAYTALAFASHAEGQHEGALEAAQQAVRLHPKYDASHYILGLCYMESGEDEKAIAEFETFLDLTWDRAYVRDYKVNAKEYLAQLQAVD
jgi:tetratricopeptide (TPR) repeat protein